MRNLTKLQKLVLEFIKLYEDLETQEKKINKDLRELWGDFAPSVELMHPYLNRLVFDLCDEVLEEGSSEQQYGGPLSYYFYEARNMPDGGRVEYKELGKSFKIKTLGDVEKHIKWLNGRASKNEG